MGPDQARPHLPPAAGPRSPRNAVYRCTFANNTRISARPKLGRSRKSSLSGMRVPLREFFFQNLSQFKFSGKIFFSKICETYAAGRTVALHTARRSPSHPGHCGSPTANRLASDECVENVRSLRAAWYWRLSSPRQSWVLSGASIPQSRMRAPKEESMVQDGHVVAAR
jgi:hypothetical protein